MQHHVRFWSTVLHVETDAGRVWLKENAPSQSFEAGLITRTHGCAPGWVAESCAVDEGSGLLATADLGGSMWGEDVAERISCLHPAESWRRLEDDVPFDAVDERFRRAVPEWLTDAAAPDPFRSAMVR